MFVRELVAWSAMFVMAVLGVGQWTNGAYDCGCMGVGCRLAVMGWVGGGSAVVSGCLGVRVGRQIRPSPMERCKSESLNRLL